MADIEKVIKCLELCRKLTDSCEGCPYENVPAVENCMLTMHDDALELLKEQEVKTGYWIDSAGNDKCSICGEEYSDLYPDYGNTHFCPNCGAKMEGRWSE